MKDILTKKYLINGPNNIIRLTNGDKIIYIYGDYHLSSEYQTECIINEKYESIDSDKLLNKFMHHEKKIEFDIFIEMDDIDFIPETYIYKYNYINSFRKMAKANIKKDANNKILINNKFPNFRFHFFDIRNHLPINLNRLYNYNGVSFYFPYSIRTRLNIIAQLKDYNIEINFLINFLEKNDDKLLNKITSNKKINELYNDNIQNIKNLINDIQKCILLIEKNITINYTLHPLINNNAFNILYDIYINYETIICKYRYYIVLIADLFLLRRVLDKSYIKKSIIYTGAFHFTNITFILVKYFNFKITNLYYSKDMKIDNINTFISKNTYNSNNIYNLLYNHLTNTNEHGDIIQCSNLFDFPNNFL